MEYVYSWDPAKPVSGLKDIDPGKFAHELERIEQTHGQLTGAILASEASDKTHIAHGFIYNVGQRKAARLYYEERARLLIRCHIVSAVDTPELSVRARIAVRADDDDGGEGHDRYLAAQEVALRPDLRDLHRVSLLRRMNLLRQELVSFDEFVEVVTAIEKVLEKEVA